MLEGGLSIRGRLAAVAAVAFAFAVAASPASAITRFAHPDGGGVAPCTQSTPPEVAICSITTAVGAATSGDEVVLLPDTPPDTDPHGPLLSTLQIPNGVLVRGPGPGSLAQLVSTGVAADYAVDLGTNAALQDVNLDVGNTAEPNLGIDVGPGGRVERVRVDATDSSVACHLGGSGILIRDTVCWTSENNARALEAVATNATLRNVTAWNFVVGGSGIRAIGSTTLRATNVIAQGDDTGLNRDVAAAGDAATSITIDHSNFSSFTTLNGATVVDGGGNTTATPDFVSDDLGDFRPEATSASTIDMGISTAVNGFGIGSFDLGGAGRCQGAAPDIGAFELAGPACPTPPGSTPTPPKKKCKKGRKLKKGKCVKKKRKKRKK